MKENTMRPNWNHYHDVIAHSHKTEEVKAYHVSVNPTKTLPGSLTASRKNIKELLGKRKRRVIVFN